MKSIIRSILRRALACALFVASISSGTVFAAPKKIKPLNPSDVFTVSDGKGGVVNCTLRKGAPILAVKEKSKYFLGADAIKKLQTKLGQSSGKTREKLQKNLKKLKKEVKDGNVSCKNNGTPSKTLTPISRALTRADVQLLLEKAGLGLSSREESLVDIGVNQGVAALVDAFMSQKSESTELLSRITDSLDGQIGTVQTQSPAGQRRAILDLWVNTANPYSERLALFLLSVWTAAGDVIEDETFRHVFWNYYTRLRDSAAGDTLLPDLGVAITRDPLMLIYLNNELNVKGNPNENYARELMELFTLGPVDLDGNPNYTETQLDGTGDIAVAARMLTGWKVNKNYQINDLVVQQDSSRHEPGPHTMFAGKPYSFSGENDEDLVRGIFAHHPGVKYYYAREILKEYLTPMPPRALVESFALVIESNGYKLRPALRTLFMSEAFYDASYRDTVPMNSLEFAAKVCRYLGLFDAINTGEAERQMQLMGMQVNYAPSVFWYNSYSWVSSSVLLDKANFIAQVMDDNTAQALPNPDWTPALVLPTGSVSARGLQDFIAARLGIDSLNDAQKSALDGYVTTLYQNYNNSYTPFSYDNTKSDHQRRKGLGLYYLLFLTSTFQLN